MSGEHFAPKKLLDFVWAGLRLGCAVARVGWGWAVTWLGNDVAGEHQVP